jgi:hypothetical protein
MTVSKNVSNLLGGVAVLREGVDIKERPCTDGNAFRAEKINDGGPSSSASTNELP